MKKLTIDELRLMRESEDHVEFKKGEGGNVSYNGSDKKTPKDRRRCILGYVTALSNEGGGYMVIGMHDHYPHDVIGTAQCVDGIGALIGDIYRDMGIRVDAYELYAKPEGKEAGIKGNRILVIAVPPRPIGKVYKFEDVPLMRVGEDLRPMDDETFLSIIQEREPDFSQQICDGLTLDDLDPEALKVMKRKYAEKQNNPSFANLPDMQILREFELIKEGRLTNAALILLGKGEAIHRFYCPRITLS